MPRVEEMALFLVDIFGNEVLLHREVARLLPADAAGGPASPAVVPDRIDPTQR